MNRHPHDMPNVRHSYLRAVGKTCPDCKRLLVWCACCKDFVHLATYEQHRSGCAARWAQAQADAAPLIHALDKAARDRVL